MINSFYTVELASVFEYPKELEGLSIRLIDKDNNIIFSSDTSEVGMKLPEEINELISTENNQSIISKNYLVTVSECNNNWRIVCSISTNIILKEIQMLLVYTTFITVLIAVVFVLIGFAIIRKFSGIECGITTNTRSVCLSASGSLVSGNSYTYQTA